FFFFFQAEDGIRDYKVTGVQTCALPIYESFSSSKPGFDSPWGHKDRNKAVFGLVFFAPHQRKPVWFGCAARFARVEGEVRAEDRSEERRVGKECGGRAWR